MPGNVINNISRSNSPAAPSTAGDFLDESLNYILPGDKTTGYKFLDESINGWVAGDLVAIIGYSSTGKTTFALDLAIKARTNDGSLAHVLYLTTQANDKELQLEVLKKQVGAELGIFKHNNPEPYEWAELEDAASEIKEYPQIDFFSQSHPSVKAVNDKICEKMAEADSPYDLVVIDAFHDLEVPYRYDNRCDELSYNSRELKRIARELEIPIIVVATVPRANRKGSSSRVMLEDVGAFNGTLDCEADIIIATHKTDYIGLSEDPDDYDRVEFCVLKNRRGSYLPHETLKYNRSFHRYDEMDDTLYSSFAMDSSLNDSFGDPFESPDNNEDDSADNETDNQ